MTVTRACLRCQKMAARYDPCEDCWLCLSCGALTYPQDYGEPDNPDAWIWKTAHA